MMANPQMPQQQQQQHQQQQQQQQQQQSYQNYVSPHPPYTLPVAHQSPYLPPTKRPRLTHDAGSPYASPQMTNGSLPNQNFSQAPQPYYPLPGQYQYQNSYLHHQNGNMQRPVEPPPPPPPPPPPAPAPQPSTMGPPARPELEKPVDVNDISDVLNQSGVDLREEEAALTNRRAAAAQQQPLNGTHYGSDMNNSFGPSHPPSQSGYYERPYYNTLQTNLPGDRGSFYGAGSLNQTPVSVPSAEELTERKKTEALRARALHNQYHLNAPFIDGHTVWKRLYQKTNVHQVTIPPSAQRPPPPSAGQQRIWITGPEGQSRLVVVKDQLLTHHGSQAAEILSLLSLATKDRMRSILEDAAALAKGRRSTSHGVVPIDLVDFATGTGKAEEVPVPGASSANPRKRSISQVASDTLPTPISQDPPTPNPEKTIAFSNRSEDKVANFLRGATSAEEDRLNRRTKRNAAGLVSGEVSRAASISVPSGPGTPGTIGEQAPYSGKDKPMNKKELKRQADALAESMQSANTNMAASMALGGKSLFGRSKAPSWMTSSKSSPAIPKPVAPVRSASKAGPVATEVAVIVKQGLGSFREDSTKGQNIQLRDVVATLEPDQLEKRTLSKAYSKLNATDKDGIKR